MDYLIEETGKDSLFHMEFQYNATNKDDLKRFYRYNIEKQTETGKLIDTCVVNFQKEEKCETEETIGKTINFMPINKFLGDIDFEERLNNIINKVENNVKLSSKNQIDLILITLAPQTKDKRKTLETVCDIVGNAENFEIDNYKMAKLKQLIEFQITQFVNKKQQKELKKRLNMNAIEKQMEEDIIKIIKDDEYYKGLEKGYDEGYNERKEEETEFIERIIINLIKNNHNIKFIQTITEMSENEILKIAKKHNLNVKS